VAYNGELRVSWTSLNANSATLKWSDTGTATAVALSGRDSKTQLTDSATITLTVTNNSGSVSCKAGFFVYAQQTNPAAVDVFIVAGQSNAWGTSPDPENSPATGQDGFGMKQAMAYIPFNFELQPNSAMVQPFACGSWQQGSWYNSGNCPAITQEKDPTNWAYKTSGGVAGKNGSSWPAFANAYYAATGHKVAFIHTASGGSSLLGTDQFNGWWTGGGSWDPSAGWLFTAAMQTFDLGMQAFRDQGYTPQFMGVLWIQGEADAGGLSASTEQNYIGALNNLISSMRAWPSVQWPTMPFYIFQTGTYADNCYNYDSNHQPVSDLYPDVVSAFGYHGNCYGHDGATWGALREAQNKIETAVPYVFVVSRQANSFAARGMMYSTERMISHSNDDMLGVHYLQMGYNENGTVGAKNVAAAVAAMQTHWDLPRDAMPLDAGEFPLAGEGLSALYQNPHHAVSVYGFVNKNSSCAPRTYSIDYGDGSAKTPAPVPDHMCGPYYLHSEHTYSQAGTYQVTTFDDQNVPVQSLRISVN